LNIFQTPIYLAGQELARKHWAELEPALKRCKTVEEKSRCLSAYAHKHRAEFDVLGQQHGLAPMEWPIP
jgi:hypothetical protein